MAKAEAIQATKDDDLTAADREAIEQRQKNSGPVLSGIAAVKLFTKETGKKYQFYRNQFHEEMKKAHLRQKAAQEIANFYHHPELNGGHEIIEDTLAYLNEITAADFEDYIRIAQAGYDYNTEPPENVELIDSPEQHFLVLETYGHTVPAARHFLNDAIDLMTLAIHKLGIDGKKAIEEEVLDIAYKWRDGWKEAGIDDTETLKKLRDEIDRNDAINWANGRFSAPNANPDDDPDYEPKFSDAFFYQDAERHAGLFDRNRFKNRLKELNKKDWGAIEKTEAIQLLDYYRTSGFFESARDLGELHEITKPQIRHYEDSKESAIQFIKDYWLEDHYKACRILGKDTKGLDEIAEKRAAVFYDPVILPDIQKTYFPDNYIKPKDKLSNTIFDGKDRLFDRQFKALSMESKNAAKEITTYVKLGLDEGFENVSMPKLSRYESIVHDAVGALCDAGNQFITLGMVNRAMSGDAKAKLTASKKTEIRDALLRLMHSAISIKSDDEDYVYDGHVLEAQLLTKQATVRGQKVPQDFILKIVGDLPLYQYAKRKKQIIKGPIETLNPPISKTRENELLIDYLLRRISWTNQKDTVNILFSTIYSQLGISLDRKNKDKRTRLRKPIMAILDYWKDIGRIKEYHFENDKGEPVTATRQPYRIVIVKHENK